MTPTRTAPTLAGFVVTVEQVLWCIYSDINADELIYSIEDWLGCPLDSPGFSPAALDEAKAANCYDLFEREEESMTTQDFLWTNERIIQRHNAIIAECQAEGLSPTATLLKCCELAYTIAQDAQGETERLTEKLQRVTDVYSYTEEQVKRLQTELAERRDVANKKSYRPFTDWTLLAADEALAE